MENALQKLNENIEKIRPEFYNNLETSLSKEKIKKLEDNYKVQIPNDLKALYKWKNGQKDNCYEAFVNNSIFIPLDQALDTAQELTSMIGTDFEIENWWNENWIPIFHNGGGSYICYDLAGIFTGEKGQIIEYWNRDNDRNVIASNLENFLNQLNKLYESKPKEEFDEFYSVIKENGFPKEFKVE